MIESLLKSERIQEKCRTMSNILDPKKKNKINVIHSKRENTHTAGQLMLTMKRKKQKISYPELRFSTDDASSTWVPCRNRLRRLSARPQAARGILGAASTGTRPLSASASSRPPSRPVFLRRRLTGVESPDPDLFRLQIQDEHKHNSGNVVQAIPTEIWQMHRLKQKSLANVHKDVKKPRKNAVFKDSKLIVSKRH